MVKKIEPRHQRVDSLETRAKILSAAEKLFTEHNIEDVSLLMIRSEAGQRNKSVVCYHFGDKDGIIWAIVKKHESETRRRANEMLENFRSTRKLTLKDIATAIVIPLADKLNDPDGGVAYIRIMDQLLRYHRLSEIERHMELAKNSDDEIWQISRHLLKKSGEKVWILEMILWSSVVLHALADYSRLIEHGSDRNGLPSQDLLVNYLINVLEALMNIPIASKNNRGVDLI